MPRAQAPLPAPLAVSPADAAAAAVVEEAEPEPSSPCELLERRVAALQRADAQRAERTVRDAIAADADPLAAQRAALATRLRSAPPAQRAAAEAELARAREAHLRAQLAGRALREDDVDPLRLPLEGELCWAHRGGAWALTLDALALVPGNLDDWRLPWQGAARAVVAHVDEEGTVRTAPLETFLSSALAPPRWSALGFTGNCCQAFGASLSTPLRFDYDGDGSPELLVAATFAHEGEYQHWARLYTFREGAVRPYPTPERFELREGRDVDGDGRPDLVSFSIVDGGSSCGSGFPITGTGPEFAAISLTDGTFDGSGPRARAFAREWCPRPPSALTTVAEVVCARLWGRAVPELERVLRRTTAPMDCALSDEGRPQRDPRARPEYELLQSALAVPLPFTLAPPAPASRRGSAR